MSELTGILFLVDPILAGFTSHKFMTFPFWMSSGLKIVDLVSPMLFPQRLPKPSNRQCTDADAIINMNQERNPSLAKRQNWSTTKESLRRLLSNKIFVLNLITSSVTFFVFSGFGTFLPKFYQVRKKNN